MFFLIVNCKNNFQLSLCFIYLSLTAIFSSLPQKKTKMKNNMSDNQNILPRLRRSELTAETRQLDVFKYNQGLSVPRIFSNQGLLRSTIYEIIQLFCTRSRILTKKATGIIVVNFLKKINYIP
ncbi:hypothetical protein CDIK_3983 [Cucumispora dikerogammari]|nr:hypothetical protein CDIK_3983 [Cucumispora dikerogammari]